MSSFDSMNFERDHLSYGTPRLPAYSKWPKSSVSSLRIPANNPQLSVEARAAVAGLGILGYAVARPYWQQGYASESATRMVAFAFDELGLIRLQASPLRGNRASQRILERLNFRVTEAGVTEAPLYGGPAHLVDRYTLVRGNTTAEP
jgi:RimJ/RimL family protein N-acetyltransferase